MAACVKLRPFHRWSNFDTVGECVMAATDIAAPTSEVTPPVTVDNCAPVLDETHTEDDSNTAAETVEPPGSGEPKWVALKAEAGEAAEQAPSEAPPFGVPEAVNLEATPSPRDTELPSEELPPEPQRNFADDNGEHVGCATENDKEIEEPGEESRGSGMEECDKKTTCVDGDKLSGGHAALGDKRRPSVEMSSSDGEPLSRMDSEDSISSTLMEMESTVSSGRSTPAMMNGQSNASSSAVKTVAYSCCWDLCLQYFNSSPDLAEHIRGVHVDGQRGGVFVCLWKGCKVYNTPSTSQSWLQRHMLTHSGDKPFKCVVGGCTASFASQGGLARHVPTHFSQQSSSKMSSQAKLKEESPSKAGLNKRKKLKNKRRCSLPRPHDFFDAQTMDAIRHRAICLNLSTHIESVGNGHSVVFSSTVLAKRKEGSGKVNVLLHWIPEDMFRGHSLRPSMTLWWLRPSIMALSAGQATSQPGTEAGATGQEGQFCPGLLPGHSGGGGQQEDAS
ncbi:zinc finger protein AEBP2-like isoform X3 [Hippocampus zosterae]|uniref:zinc finger protein AEBP2-like isoform X3 n=1 Tax=Hippocampus zosterae TaxID=109293 RepID=UPI00223D59DB|nr:zinc finger protein AEBP2-like isoform X3 [Hippocampus zosterae]